MRTLGTENYPVMKSDTTIFNLDKAIEIVHSNQQADTLELITNLLILADKYLTCNGYANIDELPLNVKQQVNLEILHRVSNPDFTERANEILESIGCNIDRNLSELDYSQQTKVLEKLQEFQEELEDIL